MTDFLLILFGVILGIFISLLPYFYKQQEASNNLTIEDHNIISQMIHASRRQNELLTDNMELVTEHKIKLLTAAFDRAMSYNNVVISLGYAVIFTTLTVTKENLSIDVIVWSYTLAGISVILFVGFTIYSMLFHMTGVQLQAETIKSQTLEEFLRNDYIYQLTNAHRLKVMMKVWNIVFPSCLVTGFGAALIIIFFNIYNLIKY